MISILEIIFTLFAWLDTLFSTYIIKMDKQETKMTLEELKSEYLKSLTEHEYKAYLIALDHLKGIFYLEETNGFLEWKKKRGF
jgi:hypothetical protein